MKIEGTYTFEAPRDAVWAALLDPDVLATVLPGCQKLDRVDENKYEGTLDIKVGPVQGKFKGEVEISEVQPPDSYTIQVNGRGAPGFVKGEGQVKLESQGANETLLHYAGEASVGGRIASVGQRLLDSSAKALTRQSLDGLHRQIKARSQPGAMTYREEAPVPKSVPEPPPGPSQVEFAAGVAKHMFEDLVPEEKRPTLVYGVLGTVGVIILLNWLANLIAERVVQKLKARR